MALDDIKGLIEEGNKTIEALRADVDALSAKDALSREKLSKMEADLAATFAEKQKAEMEADAQKKRLDEMEAKLNRPGKAGASKEADEHKEAFLAFVRNPQDYNAQTKLTEMQAKATDTRTSTAGSGGYAVPEVIATEIARQVQDLSPIRQIARVVTTGTPDYKELVDLNGFGFEWVGEVASRAQTDTPDLGECAPTFGEIAAKPEATRHALEDIFFGVESWLQDSGARQFAIAEGAAFVAGNGTNKPTGFLNGTPVTTVDASRAFGTLQYYASGAAATLGTDTFSLTKTVVYGLKAGYRPGSRWVMNSNTMATLAKVKNSDGDFMLQRAVADSVPDRIEGYRITIAEDMPDVAANAFPMAFGDFSRGYLIADRVGLGIVRDEVTKPGYIRYIMYRRVGGKVKDSNAIRLVKCEV